MRVGTWVKVKSGPMAGLCGQISAKRGRFHYVIRIRTDWASTTRILHHNELLAIR